MTLKKLLILLLVNLDNWIDFVAVVDAIDQRISVLLLMSLVMVAESLVAVLLFVWFVVIILAALIVETLPLIPAMRLVAKQKEAEFPAVIERVSMSQMIEVALEYVKMSPLTAVVVDASSSMFAKKVMKSVSLIAGVGTIVFALSLLNAAQPPGTNVPMMMVWQPVGIPMFGEWLFVSVLVNTLTAVASPVLSLWNVVQIIVTNRDIPYLE